MHNDAVHKICSYSYISEPFVIACVIGAGLIHSLTESEAKTDNLGASRCISHPASENHQYFILPLSVSRLNRQENRLPNQSRVLPWFA
jgi:hypothetical protein